jgi:hypothetical protein
MSPGQRWISGLFRMRDGESRTSLGKYSNSFSPDTGLHAEKIHNLRSAIVHSMSWPEAPRQFPSAWIGLDYSFTTRRLLVTL